MGFREWNNQRLRAYRGGYKGRVRITAVSVQPALRVGDVAVNSLDRNSFYTRGPKARRREAVESLMSTDVDEHIALPEPAYEKFAVGILVSREAKLISRQQPESHIL